jgi:hypothetical protein
MTETFPDEERAPMGEHEALEWRLKASERAVQALLKRYTALEKKLESIRAAHVEYVNGRITLDDLEFELVDALRVS